MDGLTYSISRRPIVVPRARETTLPGGVVIDATSWATTAERSRLPIDPKTLYVDILVNSNGQVVPTTEYSSPTSADHLPFYHFWLSERPDVHEITDLWGGTGTNPVASPNANPNSGMTFALPMPLTVYQNSNPALATIPNVSLKGERWLISLFTRTGYVASNSIENFSTLDISAPFYAAQQGARESK